MIAAMDCTEAYREALTRDYSNTPSSKPGPGDLDTQVPAAAGAVAGSSPAVELRMPYRIGENLEDVVRWSTDPP